MKKILIALLCAAAGLVNAAELKIVIPWSAGGFGDLSGRILQKALAEELGTNIQYEYKLGAGGAIATAYVNSTSPSEPLLYIEAIGLIVNNINDLDGTKTKNIHHLAVLGNSHPILVASKKSGIKTYDEFLAVAKTKTLTYGSAGFGTSPHLYPTIFGRKANREFVHVPFKGQSALLPYLVSGDVDFAIINGAPIRSYVDSNMVTPLAIISEKRTATFPNLPTFIEKRVVGLEHYGWLAAFTNLPIGSDEYNKLCKALNKVLTDPEVRAKLTDIGVFYTARKDTGVFIENEKKRLRNDIPGLTLE